MFWFLISAKPNPGTPRFGECGGAYVSCWINFALRDGAELLARHYIEAEGWKVLNVEEWNLSKREHYEDEEESLQYFLEAENDGASFVFHEYPEEDWEPKGWPPEEA